MKATLSAAVTELDFLRLAVAVHEQLSSGSHSLLPQRLHGQRGQAGQAAATRRLRLDEHQATAALTLNSVPNLQAILVQVDIPPSEAQGLSDAEPAVPSSDHRRLAR